MPAISRFYGITAILHPLPKEHNPPRIHATRGDQVAAISITDCSLMEGKPPKRSLTLATPWVKLHQQELLPQWNSNTLQTIDPLSEA